MPFIAYVKRILILVQYSSTMLHFTGNHRVSAVVPRSNMFLKQLFHLK